MKYYLFCLFAFLSLASNTCQERNLAPSLFSKTWLYAYEEDSLDIRTYRPRSYSFPPSRGRTGFAFEKNGTFKFYGIAPTDGLEEHPGRWKLVKKDLVRITFDKGPEENFDLELVSLADDVIKVRFHSRSEN